MALVEPHATHAPMYSKILLQDLDTFIPHLLVDSQIKSFACIYVRCAPPFHSKGLFSFFLQETDVKGVRWMTSYIFQRAVDHGITFAALVRC